MNNLENGRNKAIQKIRVKALLFLVLALAAGGGAVALVRWYLARVERNLHAVPVTTQPVVVASAAIPIGTTLAKPNLELVQWPAKNVPPGSFSLVEKVIGRTVIQNVVKGEPILVERLADQSAGRGMAAVLAKGTRAMAVKVDQVVGIAGFVQPGDFVDVITTMMPDEETKKSLRQQAAKISKIILQNIKVVAIGTQLTSSGSKPVTVQVVTLEVTPEQSERLALASRHGEIQLTMRSRIDQQPVPTAGVTPVALLAPDEGAAQEKKEAPKEPAAVASYRPRPRPKRAAVEVEKKPEGPVVEILRGDKIEERKLRPTADSQR